VIHVSVALAGRIRQRLARRKNVEEFDVTGRPMKGWVLIGPEGVGHNEQLTDWIERATRFVRTLPAKEK
jgi:hypothetical protein